MAVSRQFLLFLTGIFENFLYTGMVVGWASVNYMLKKEGVFHHLCEEEELLELNATTPATTPVSSVPTELNFYRAKFFGTLMVTPLLPVEDSVSILKSSQQMRSSCAEQDRLLNLAFNVSVCVSAGMGSVLAYVCDRLGMRVLRCIHSVLLTGGFLMIAFTSKDVPFLIYPGLAFVAVSVFSLRISTLQIAELFPRHRSTIISLYSGLSTASSSIIIVIKIIYDAGLDWTHSFLIMAALTLLALPITFFLLPANSIQELMPDDDKSPKERVAAISAEVAEVSIDSCIQLPTKSSLPITHSIFTVNSLLYNFWFCWMALYSFYYLGSLSLWVQRISNSLADLSIYTDTLGLTLLAALVIAPLGGVLMDYSMRSTEKQFSVEKRSRCCFVALMIPTVALCCVQVSKFFDHTAAIYVSIVGFTILRSLMVGVSSSFLRVRFPAEHFNRLIGITGTIRGICFLLQFPMFYWESVSKEQAFNLTVFNMICLLLSCILPIHLLTPLLGILVRREDRAAARYKEQQIT